MNFSLQVAINKYNNGIVKDKHKDCKEYIQQYLFPGTNGSHYEFRNGRYIEMSEETIKVYMNRLPKAIVKWYFNENVKLYDPDTNNHDDEWQEYDIICVLVGFDCFFSVTLSRY